MASRRKFLEQGALCAFSLMIPSLTFASDGRRFEGKVVNDSEGEIIRMRDGTAIVKIKIAKIEGSKSVSFLSESFKPGDFLPVHKHMNEDELIFIHKGSGVFTLGDKEYPVEEGAVAIVPKGVWHGLKNTGKENMEMRFSYTPSGFEGFFREVGTPEGRPFVQKTMEQRRAIAKKWGMIYQK